MEIDKAVKILKAALAHLGIKVRVEKTELSRREFKTRPQESNRIWMAERPLEDWLNAQTGKSECCDACGSEHCRTVAVGNETFEAIPNHLIIRAGFLAAADLIRPSQATQPKGIKKNRGCCR